MNNQAEVQNSAHEAQNITVQTLSNSDAVVVTSNIRDSESILVDITRRLYARQLIGKAIVVAENPTKAHIIIRKHWLRITRQHLKQRNETLNAAVIHDLSKTIATMQSLRFTTLAPFEDPANDVFILEPSVLQDILPEAATMFVTCDVNEDDLVQIIQCMPHLGLAVKYTP